MTTRAPFPPTEDSRTPGYVNEASNRQMDRMMATASPTMPARRPGAEADDPMTVIAVEGKSGQTWHISFGPADIEAVINELALGAPCGICHHNPCAWRSDGGMS
jgi:hypothetical protein